MVNVEWIFFLTVSLKNEVVGRSVKEFYSGLLAEYWILSSYKKLFSYPEIVYLFVDNKIPTFIYAI